MTRRNRDPSILPCTTALPGSSVISTDTTPSSSSNARSSLETHPPQFIRPHLENILTLEKDFAVGDATGWNGQDALNGLHGRGLATAGFTYQPNLLANIDLEVYAIQNSQDTPVYLKLNLQILDFQERRREHARPPRQRTGRVDHHPAS